MAKSWKEEEKIWTNRVAFNSFMRCRAAMFATKPMPGNPSIRMGSLSCGFSLISIEQTMTVHFGGVLEKQSDIRMPNLWGVDFPR
jgi:hypothetical protein